MTFGRRMLPLTRLDLSKRKVSVVLIINEEMEVLQHPISGWPKNGAERGANTHTQYTRMSTFKT